jgi:DNA-binding IclR family transcriptional regulator
MTRGNPSLDRAVTVLALLGAAPERSFTLAEIARQTELSKATVHALLASLTSAKWLLRHPTGPSYRLGPGLIALGEAARQGYPELPYALDQMRELGTRLGLEVLASAVVDGEIVILGKAGVPAPSGVSAAIGQRVPLVPPLATVFFAWAGEQAVRAAFGGAPLTETYRRGLAAVRERGYAVGLENPVRERIGRTFAAQLARGQLRGPAVTELVTALADEDYQLIESESATGTECHWLSHLAAPVFDSTGRVSLALTLVGFASALPASEIHRLGELLRTAAGAVSEAVHGRTPVSPTPAQLLHPHGGVAVPS